MNSEQQSVLAQPAVEIIRVVNYPREQVWRAWTDPQRFAAWWPGEGFEARDISFELREGAQFCWGLRSLATGDEYIASGSFREVRAPERFVISWDSLHNDSYYIRDAQVTISFRALDERRTEVRILHEFLNEAAQCSAYSLGWNSAFDNLARQLAEEGAAVVEALGTAQRNIQLKVEIALGAAEIWPWLTEADRLTQWFPAEAEITARAGGSYHFTWHRKDGGTHERSGSISAVEPPLLLDLEWFPSSWDPDRESMEQWREASRTMVYWRLRETGSGSCVVSLQHGGWGYGEHVDEMFRGHAEGWQLYVSNLKEVLEGRGDIR